MTRFYTLDVFTDHLFGGNALAVILDSRGVPEESMQKIAREFNLSETVFVLPARGADAVRRLRIFTPERELPFAGHPTIGTAHLLWELGVAPAAKDGVVEFVLEEEVGLVPIRIVSRNEDLPFVRLTTAQLPEEGPPAPGREVLAAALGLGPQDLASGEDRPEAYSCGVPYLFVPLRSREALRRATPDLARWRTTLDPYWAPQVYLFCREPERPGSQLRARMFAPTLGVFEDPATGSAVASLAGYLAARMPDRDGTHQWIVEQGFEMGRPSILTLELEMRSGILDAVRVGGTAVRVSEGDLRI